MPTWGEILVEIRSAFEASGPEAIDTVRRKYLTELSRHSKRNVILYATKWTQGNTSPDHISLTTEDVQGFMEVVHGLKGEKLDLVLHSPGGSIEATEAIVTYLRSKFTDIRVIIPQAAMSAATMLACSANRIVMGCQSSIGPIDPQFIMRTEMGVNAVAAHAILEQFEIAKSECRDPALLPSWLPILRQYGPALIVQCRLAIELARSLAGEWMAKYMLSADTDAENKARKIADHLVDHKAFKSHSRYISRDKAKALGLVVDDLESDQIEQDLTLSVFHAVTHTFDATPAVKIIENQNGKAFIKRQQMIVVKPPPHAES